MKNLKLIGGLALMALTLASCSKSGRCINGSGDYTSRQYSLSAFDEISFYGDGDVVVSQDSVRSVRVEAQQNVIDELNVEVVNGELQIGRDNCFRGSKRIKVYVSTPSLTMAHLSGSGSISGSGVFTETDFRAEISGSGSINFDIDVQNLDCSSSGSGDLRFSGRAVHQHINMSSSGDAHCFALEGEDATVRISGSGRCEVNVSDHLDVNISGSGDVFYRGNPVITSKISGSGRLIHKG